MTQISLTKLNAGYRAIVVGARGGLGQAFCSVLKTDPRCGSVIAASRSGESIAGVTGVRIDLDDPDTIQTAIQTAHGETGLDLVIIASGILHREDGLRPERSWRELDEADMMEVYRVNTILPALIARESLPLLAATSKAQSSPVLFATLSARVGSISDNRLGGWHSYRASKAALNQLIQTLSIELQRKAPLAMCVGLHPGTVDTALSKPFQRGVPEGKLFDPSYSASQLMSVLDGLTPQDTGGVFDWAGDRIPA